MTFPGRLEIALNADRSNHALTWDWTDITTYSDEEQVDLKAGLIGDARVADPADLTVLLRNDAGRFTPRLATGAYYPHWHRGVPLRFSVEIDEPYLLANGSAGSRASTPDAASLDITGDMFAAVEVWAPLATPRTAVGTYEFFGKSNPGGNQRSWLLWLFTDTLWLRWSTNGVTEQDATSTVPLPRPAAGPFTLGVHMDVDNGAGGHTVTFYAVRGSIADLEAALTAGDDSVILGDPVIGSGTTSFFAGTAPLEVGDITSSGFGAIPAMFRRAILRSGNHTGTIVANPDFTIQTVGATSFNDTAAVPKTWTVGVTGLIDNALPRFIGEINAIRPRWPGHGVEDTAQVEVTASGVLRRLRQGGDTETSALYNAITAPSNADAVVAYWPSEDGTDSTQVASATPGVAPMAVSGDVRFAADDSLPSSRPLPTVGSGDSSYWAAPIPAIPQPVGFNWQITRFFRIDDPAVSPARTDLISLNTSGTAARWGITINDTSVAITALSTVGGSVVSTSFPSDARFFDTWAMIVLEVEDDGANVDWTVSLIPIPLGLVFATSGTFAGNPGIPTLFRNDLVGPPSGVSVGHTIVTKDKSLGWLAPADTGYVGERAVDRARRLCAEQGISIAVHDDTTTELSEPMGPQRPARFVDQLASCAEADGGILAEARDDLGFSFRTRGALYNQARRLDLTDGLVPPFDPDDDDLTLVNDVTVTREGGSSGRAVDQDSIDTEGRYEASATVNLAGDGRTVDHAAWRVHQGTVPELRHNSLTVEIAKDGSLPDAWLATALGDVIGATNALAEYPTGDIDQLMNGYTETVSAHVWTVTANTSPASAWNVGVRDDDELGRRDTAGSVLDADYDAGTDTSIDVDTTVGPLWTVEAADCPFDLNVGGARVHVTAVGAPSGTVQTMTVDAATVNGITKTVPAGTDVRLWQPTIRAL